MSVDDEGNIIGDFTGKRAKLTCLKVRKGKRAKTCYRKHSFSFSI